MRIFFWQKNRLFAIFGQNSTFLTFFKKDPFSTFLIFFRNFNHGTHTILACEKFPLGRDGSAELPRDGP
jgi:hypothetical protein